MAYGSKTIQALYYRSPAVVKNFVASVYGFRQRRERYGDAFHRSLAFLRESQSWPHEKLVDFQWRKTAAFITHACLATPYYKETAAYHAVRVPADIRSLPLLTKSTVRSEARRLQPDTLGNIPHRWLHTSGTTGTSLSLPISNECFQREYAFRALHYEWGGVSLDGRDRVAFCAGHPVAGADQKRPPFWIYDRANNWLFLSSYHMSEYTLAGYARELERFNPVMVGGYPSSVYLLALAYAKHGTVPLHVKAVYCSSETLFDFQRHAIERAFGAKVFNWYGNTEMCANIVECDQGEMHLKLEHSLMEVLDEKDASCGSGTRGRLVCTGFGNAAFPLIRYDVGDEVVLSKDQTARCGRGGILVDEVSGRVEDYVVSGDGRLVGRLDHLFKETSRVVEAQVFQETAGEVVLRIVRDSKYDRSDEAALLEEAHRRLGTQTVIRFEYVASIPRGKGGKFRFIDSRLNRETILRPLAGQ